MPKNEMDIDMIVRCFNMLNASVRKLGFGDAVGKPDIGAVEGLTMHLDDKLAAVETQLSHICASLDRIADALEAK